MPRLSMRLEAVRSLLQPCELLADIGTDHGLLPIAAVCLGPARRAIGVDVNTAPLDQARRNVRRARAPVELILGDGLDALGDRPVDAVTIAGLTGPTVVSLLEAGAEVLARVRQVVVQPVLDLHRVRAWALANGWHLRAEVLVRERGRFFGACAFEPGHGPDPAYAVPGWSEVELCLIGPHLLARKDPAAFAWCTTQRARVHRWAKAAERAFWDRAIAALADPPTP